jgi:hypothetical protein
MKEKCCKNCLFFIDNSKVLYPSLRHQAEYACRLHGSEANVTDPFYYEIFSPSQFCGDEHWISVKVKTRIENLEKLGI